MKNYFVGSIRAITGNSEGEVLLGIVTICGGVPFIFLAETVRNLAKKAANHFGCRWDESLATTHEGEKIFINGERYVLEKLPDIRTFCFWVKEEIENKNHLSAINADIETYANAA